MKVLLVGSGGREHALAWSLHRSPQLGELYCAPGNPGTASLGTNVPIDPLDLKKLVLFAKEKQVDLTIVGPEAPLVAGIVDSFQAEGLRIAGPNAAAARLEGSKSFAKDFMKRHSIPTGAYAVFDSPPEALQAVRQGHFDTPLVVKADGLAAGKGVLICRSELDAEAAIARVMQDREFGTAGDRIVIEEFLVGAEASFMVFSDGEHISAMVASQDHKAAYDGDQGPNTGGMGAYSTDTILSAQLQATVREKVIDPTIEGMRAEGNPFRGVLYAGLMLTSSGPRVLEFNVRFGDPETQVVVPRLQSDLLEIFWGIANGRLPADPPEWSQDPSVCVVIASGGYPGHYHKGFEITGIELAEEIRGTVVFHAGTALSDGRVVSAGGRVLGVTAMSGTLEDAAIKAYEAVNKIHFEGMFYRRDIAAKALNLGR